MLDFEKPKKIRTTDEHNGMFSSDSGIAGTYVPNMSEDDQRKWKAKIVNKGTPDARIEIRKTMRGCQLLIIVALDGWSYKHEHRSDGKPYLATNGLNVRISMNGPLLMTFADFDQINEAVKEAEGILRG